MSNPKGRKPFKNHYDSGSECQLFQRQIKNYKLWIRVQKVGGATSKLQIVDV